MENENLGSLRERAQGARELQERMEMMERFRKEEMNKPETFRGMKVLVTVMRENGLEAEMGNLMNLLTKCRQLELDIEKVRIDSLGSVNSGPDIPWEETTGGREVIRLDDELTNTKELVLKKLPAIQSKGIDVSRMYMLDQFIINFQSSDGNVIRLFPEHYEAIQDVYKEPQPSTSSGLSKSQDNAQIKVKDFAKEKNIPRIENLITRDPRSEKKKRLEECIVSLKDKQEKIHSQNRDRSSRDDQSR